MPAETRGQRRRGFGRGAKSGSGEDEARHASRSATKDGYTGGVRGAAADESSAIGSSSHNNDTTLGANGYAHHHSPHHVSTASARERTRSKIVTRVTFAIVLLAVFFGIAWAGHVYIFLLVCGIQVMLFKELVAVRYRAAMEKKTPLFRTLQWSWFVAAMFYAHGDSIVRLLREDSLLGINDDDQPEKSLIYSSFALFSTLFVMTVLTLRPGLYKYQVGQLAWTVVILLLIVGQLKVVAPNIFSGIFWYFFPASCIIVNDIMAYVCGMSMGRRFIKRPFLRLSPNKTWEGFIGAFFFTLLWAFWFSRFLARFPYFTCSFKQLRPSEEFTWQELHPGTTFHQAMLRANTVQPDRVFTQTTVVLPAALAHLLGRASLPVKPIQMHGLVIGIFGSLVAPFGGFLMSAIKRAYGIKDFDSLIPGHGGVTDRMDCQLVMILYTFVHYQTFIRHVPINYHRVWASVSALKRDDQVRIWEELGKFLDR
ncbi:hypothetical protein NSK_001428 [Nannochloropsis salina CCMP1776]|uniref:phosphatidate cytidylyltransferase n=1 Tax=Nannochloropsis salina CCMP1776 TaxID=1027361 RepID=A0A4D9D7U6_9STRA|nr:hypothetical protein NSK_001428 [Nannochloropsis salina CCMP1776]|eukprot:TFJ87094.1 hypothetical protein NSK_001428 [Nannochloropsis salina CCMP1776]